MTYGESLHGKTVDAIRVQGWNVTHERACVVGSDVTGCVLVEYNDGERDWIGPYAYTVTN